MIGELFSEDAFLWNCVWQSTVCITAGLVASFAFRHWSARAHRVLLLSMVAALIVPVMSVIVKHFELGVFPSGAVVIHSEVVQLSKPSDSETYEMVTDRNAEPEAATFEGPARPGFAAQPERARFCWDRVILWVWLAASLILVVRLVVTFVAGIRLLGGASVLSCARIQQAARTAAAKLGIAEALKVYCSDRVRSPVIWCWAGRPLLLTPRPPLQFDDRIDWVSVLCHELAHWKRRDHISVLLAELIVCILPWHPLLWWAKRRLVKLSEQACDDWVVACGQPDTDYAQSLLDLVPQGQMTFTPAVVSTEKGLGSRVRRILQGRCSNPRTGLCWALIVSLAAICFAVAVSFAQTRPAEIKVESVQTRVVHFPKDRSLGKLKIQDASIERRIEAFHYWVDNASWYERAEFIGEAKGDVKVPAGKRLGLFINNPAEWRDLSALAELRPDDLYILHIFGSYQGGPRPGNRVMEHLKGLTGLKVLDLQFTNISSDGLQYIKNFKKLERLSLPEGITNAGLAHIVQLHLLKGLYFRENRVTNKGLSLLGKLPTLEELALGGKHIGDDGLAHLAKLPKLRYLQLCGNFSNAGLVYLKNVPSLKILQLGGLPITDMGLAHLSNLTELENLDLYRTKITDEGLIHLKRMHSLKKLNLSYTQITNKGLAYLKDMKSLEYLDLPNESVTDRGLGYLAQLSKLKHLNMPSPHYVDPNMDKRLYTDKGLKELTKLQSLEELFIAGLGVTDEGMSHIAKLTNLKNLHLFGCPITNEGLAELTTLKSLRRLTLYETKVTMSGLSQLNALPNLILLNATDIKQDNSGLNISGLTKLENLTIGTPHKGGVIRDEDLACVANLKRLKWLQISSVIKKPMAISDAGMAHLGGLTNLRRLTIGGPNLTDDGLRHLANMKKLNLLNIIGGKFTDNGLSHLEGLAALQTLMINAETNFSPVAIERLRNRLPNLITLKINGEGQFGYGAYGGKRARAMKRQTERTRRSKSKSSNRR